MERASPLTRTQFVVLVTVLLLNIVALGGIFFKGFQWAWSVDTKLDTLSKNYDTVTGEVSKVKADVQRMKDRHIAEDAVKGVLPPTQ